MVDDVQLQAEHSSPAVVARLVSKAVGRAKQLLQGACGLVVSEPKTQVLSSGVLVDRELALFKRVASKLRR